MNSELHTLVELQGYDSRIATFDAEAARLPKQIEAIQASLAEAKKTVPLTLVILVGFSPPSMIVAQLAGSVAALR